MQIQYPIKLFRDANSFLQPFCTTLSDSWSEITLSKVQRIVYGTVFIQSLYLLKTKKPKTNQTKKKNKKEKKQ